jgi:hypothetical protein
MMKQFPQFKILGRGLMLSNDLEQGGICISLVMDQILQHYKHGSITSMVDKMF